MNIRRKKILLWFVVALAAVLLVFIGRPVIFLTWVWWHDPATPLAAATSGTNDASGLNPNRPSEVISVATDLGEAERQLVALVNQARNEKLHLSISGADHTMGGHTFYPGGLVLNMLPFNHLELDPEKKLLHAGAGARWSEIIPYLDNQGWSVAVMQSNNDFTVGGSLSVDCHGWQFASPPIASTVASFRLLLADGRILSCSRELNAELFSLVLGGYGMLGVILDVDLRVVPNEFYLAESHSTTAADYTRDFVNLTQGRTDIGMAYGRISVAPDSFLEEGLIVLLKRQDTGAPVSHTLAADSLDEVRRVVFRGSVGSDYGKNLRWRIEKWLGETGGHAISRNQILNEPADLYANRDPASTEILQEYFIPEARLGEFLQKARALFLRHHPDLLNITVREVKTDHDAFLCYARENVFGLVMLFHQGRDAANEAAMQACERDVIGAALECGGTYYLPYRPHATLEQFTQAYRQARDFFQAKLRFDPTEVFYSQFYENYGKPLLNAKAP